MTTAVLIVAAGRGLRATGTTAPKQYVLLAGRSVLARCIAACCEVGQVAHVQVVIHADDKDLYEAAITGLQTRARLLPPVTGGATRQDSVRLGLAALSALAPDVVLIHDAARPFVSAGTIGAVLAKLATCDAAIAAVPVNDTLKKAGADATLAGTVDRAGLWRAQTPQGFRFSRIRAAHEAAHAAGRSDFTDDAAIAEWAGLPVAIVPGSERNVKLTTAEDIAMAEQTLATMAEREVRHGTGFDVHRFAPGDGVWLCGVKLPHTHGVDAHSDGDVALHALTDAVLGAIGDGDIGIHFPPSDIKWKGAASHLFLRHAVGLVEKRGGRITNVDVTILAEAPKVSPHRARLIASIAEILGITADRVSVKATTTEGLGFTGRREGIAAMASATVTLPAA